MARPRKASSEALIKIVEDFYETEAHGDPRRLKASSIAAFAQRNGIDLKEYDFRRNAVVRQRIETLKGKEDREYREAVAAYKTLDINGLLNRCSSIDDLRASLAKIDEYWKNFYAVSQKKIEKIDVIRSENDSLQLEVKRLMKENSLYKSDYHQIEKELKNLERENKYLRSVIKKYLYSSLVDELLRECNLPVRDKNYLDPETSGRLIESRIPQTFEGIRHEPERRLSKSEKLMNSIKDQVKDNG